MALLAQNDVLFAHKALNIVPGLSANARRVAGAIIDHFNKQTGQCDPSIGRLSRLLDIDDMTVTRATASLCSGEQPLFDKVSHGGRGHRASYAPRWDTFRQIVDDWDSRMKSGANTAKVRNSMRDLLPQECGTATRKTAEQTLRSNQSNKPVEAAALENRERKPQATGAAERQKGVRKKGDEPPRQGYMVHAIAGGKGPSRREAAVAGAVRRIDVAMREKHGTAYDELTTPEILETAAQIDVKKRGAALQYLADALDANRMRAHG
jgi:hypothetical protein